jgi:predicted amidohydrolase
MSDSRTPLRAACVQLNAARPLDDVLATAGALVERAVASGANLVVLPEKWNAIGPKDRMLEAAEDLSGPTVSAMQGWAGQHGIWLVGGSISERLEGENRIRNLSLAFDPAGSLVAAYRKLHMFDVEIDGRAVRESATDRPGEELVIAELAGWPVGLTVCYDLRFPEQYRALAVAGAEVFTVPAGFMLHTGRDHWEILLRARAIENGAYVIAPNQHGSWDGNRMFGRSMIIDPWGVVVANASDGDGICVADLEPARVDAARRQLPVLQHRRTEVYGLGVGTRLTV